MKKIVIPIILLVLSGCSATQGPGPNPDNEYEVHTVNLDDGREIECISSRTYGDNGVLDCNWDPK